MIQKIMSRISEKIKKHGWKAIVGIFVYYLIRDMTLYVVLPYFLLMK